MEYPLQPLRVLAGWKIEINDLREVDPANVSDEDKSSILHEDLLCMKHQHFNRVLDVGWYGSPVHPDGEYGLVVYEGDFSGRLLYELRTPDRVRLVAEIDRLLKEIGEGRL